MYIEEIYMICVQMCEVLVQFVFQMFQCVVIKLFVVVVCDGGFGGDVEFIVQFSVMFGEICFDSCFRCFYFIDICCVDMGYVYFVCGVQDCM